MLDCADDDMPRGSWLFVVSVRHSIYTFDSRFFDNCRQKSCSTMAARAKCAAGHLLFWGHCRTCDVTHRVLAIQGFFLASLAAMRVSFAFSPNSVSKLPTSSSGGPPSMISLILLSHPNDAKQSSARTRDSMTYTSSHLTWASIRLGIAQWAQSPGSAVVP